MSITANGNTPVLRSSPDNSKPIVAHFHPWFFGRSETFIYQYISRHRKFHPVCIASKFVNLDQFPFPEGDMYSIPSTPFSLEWFNRGFLHRSPMLARRLEELQCSLVHAHFGPSGCFVVASKKQLDIPLVTTFYGYDVSIKKHIERYRDKYQVLFGEGDLFCTEGPYMRSRLIELGCPPEKVKIQRMAIPVRDIQFRERQPKTAGEHISLLFAANFVEKKGLPYLIRAVEKVNLEREDFELRVIGDGPLNQEVRSLVDHLGLGNRITFLGFLPYKQLLEEMEEADIFVHPSITAENGDSEGGAPTVILEAQSSGLPILSTNHADIPNIVVPGRSALLSPERDVEALAENMLDLMKNQGKWSEMGIAGRRFVEANHDIENEVDSLEDKYLELIGRTYRSK